MDYDKSKDINWEDKVSRYLIIGAEDINISQAMRLYDVMVLANENIPGDQQGVKIADGDGEIIAVRYIDGIDEIANELPKESLQFVVGNPKRCFVWCKYTE